MSTSSPTTSPWRLDPAAFPARIWLSRAALANNVHKLSQYAPTVQHMGIVKADAYGHGLELIVPALVELGYRWLGAAQISEALQVRALLDATGVGRHQVRVFSWVLPQTDPAVIARALQVGIDLSVSSVRDVLTVAALNLPARVHLKVDTGMSRAGVTAPSLESTLAALNQARSGGTELVGMWSHFACADEDSSASEDYTLAQIARFEDAYERATAAGFTNLVKHLAATSGSIWYPQAHYDLVRDGIGLYGLTPNPQRATTEELGFEPVLTLEADVTLTKSVPAGTTVSYGRTWKAPKSTTLALVPLGYADGVFRHASNRGEVLLMSRQTRAIAPVVGRVCMDQFMVEAPAAAGWANEDWPVRAVVFGNPQGSYSPGCPGADDWARASGTINYEIVTRLASRIPRLWMD